MKIEYNTLKLFPEFGGYGHELDLPFDIVFEHFHSGPAVGHQATAASAAGRGLATEPLAYE